MNVDFYQLDRTVAPAPRGLDGDFQLHWWQPERDGLPGRGSRRLVNYLWWSLATAGGFARPGFAELRIERAGRVVHRLIVTPRWYRFPFMGAEDLQIGDVWTSPAARRNQLASIAIAEASRRFAGDGTTIWYAVDEGNEASAALARSCGLRRVAVGRRTRRFGTALFGQYVIERFI
jgi:RimJ/RimL family protein N-acetyltransferase